MLRQAKMSAQARRPMRCYEPSATLGFPKRYEQLSPATPVGGRIGITTSAADSLQIKLFGRGAHGSMPEASIDPVVMAAATVLRLQGIVSREVPPTGERMILTTETSLVRLLRSL
jgi:metal-dependent amidase/aminoacylase/carboxypeptidase family protein